jgi:replication factor A1
VQGGEIRATFFKDACEKFYDLLEEGRVYYFSQGKLKVANKQYTSITHNYEVTFDVNAEIRMAGDDSEISSLKYTFKKIADLKDCAPQQTVDVLAVVKHASDVQELISTKRGGVQLFKRELFLLDDSNHDVKLTLWGDKAQEDLGWSSQPIVAIKCARVSAYNGVSLETVQSSNVKLNPDIPEAHALFNWLQQNGMGGSISLTVGGGERGAGSFQNRKTISVIKDDNLGFGEKADYLGFKATINYIKHDNEPWYTACPTEGCNKKVSETMDGNWFCEKCNQAFPNCQRRFILSLTVADHTGTAWVTCFNDQAKELLEAEADYLHELKTTGVSAFPPFVARV